MPLAKYYRPVLPMVLNNLIGEFAGFGKNKLVFSITPKRHFLGKIYITNGYRKKQLRSRNQWQPIRFASMRNAEKILGHLTRHLYETAGHLMHLYEDQLTKTCVNLCLILDYKV